MKNKKKNVYMEKEYSIPKYEHTDEEINLEILAYQQIGHAIVMFSTLAGIDFEHIKDITLFETFVGYWIANEYSTPEKYEKRIFKPMKI